MVKWKSWTLPFWCRPKIQCVETFQLSTVGPLGPLALYVSLKRPGLKIGKILTCKIKIILSSWIVRPNDVNNRANFIIIQKKKKEKERKKKNYGVSGFFESSFCTGRHTNLQIHSQPRLMWPHLNDSIQPPLRTVLWPLIGDVGIIIPGGIVFFMFKAYHFLFQVFEIMITDKGFKNLRTFSHQEQLLFIIRS